MYIDNSHKKAKEIQKQIEAKYEEVLREIRKEILSFVSEFEFIEYKQPVAYDRLGYFTGTSNIDALLNEIENLVGLIGSYELQMMSKHLQEVYSDINEDRETMDKALNYKWSGQNYIDNIKENNHRLAVRLRREVNAVLMRKGTNKQITETLKKEIKTAKSGSNKILVTETTYANNTALVDLFEKQGYKSYIYVARNDERTCGECAGLHRRVFNLEEATPGVTLPPMHSNCRCTIQEIK